MLSTRGTEEDTDVVKKPVEAVQCDGCGKIQNKSTVKKLGSGWFRVMVLPWGHKTPVKWFDICSPVCLQLIEMPAKVRTRSYAKPRGGE